jgi:aspartate/methionine/tyrosine aminotransferase
MNPAAKVFSADELDLIAELVVAHDCYAICDEVYEHIVFDQHRHRSLMQRPGMRDRVLRIGSAGKTFSLTGWKVGYVTGSAELLAPVVKAHQFTTFATPPALQRAVAAGLAKDDTYYAALAGDLQAKRDRLSDGLAAAGFQVAPCAGTYFVTADFGPLGFAENDVDFCRRMTIEAGVTAVPLSAFYQANPPRSFVRFCFSKRDDVLDAAVSRLTDWLCKAGRAVA